MSLSAFEAIPGKDALVEYTEKVYPIKSYVERNGFVYKSITGTSATFVPAQWELIADLREVRVPNIASRNALTGNTPTTGTTGIRIPILDNTNVLVINASADPQVGGTKFARYNYNKTNATWLLLQAGTGATNSNVSNYQLLTNKPSVISGVTVNAGAGMTGGGSIFGTSVAPYAAGGVVTISHADTSAQGSQVNSGYAYIQTLRFDTFGHVTGATSTTWTHPDTSSQATVNNTGTTYIQSISVDGAGHVTSIGSSLWTHPDTSSQASSSNGGNVFIQSIFLDGAGHVTGINTGTAAGGGGYNVKVNGDSGGSVAVLSGASITISGGTNITTLRTGNSSNPGVRVSVVPAGSTNHIQFNNSGALSSSSNLVFSAGTNTFRTTNIIGSTNITSAAFNITSTPTSGSTSDQIITRNTSTGALQRFGFTSLANILAGYPLNAIQYRTAGGFGGHAEFLFDPTTRGLTIGSRAVGTIGTRSIAVGTGNLVSDAVSLVLGFNNTTSTGGANLIVGQNSTSTNGGLNIIVGQNSNMIGNGSNAIFGNGNNITGATSCSMAVGSDIRIAVGANVFAGGKGTTSLPILVRGSNSFIYSTNTLSQTIGHGVMSTESAILGGQDHNIEVGNVRSAIIGGNGIKLTGSTYIDTVAVPTLAIFTTPSTYNGEVLTFNPISKKIGKRSIASIVSGATGAPGGSTTQVQYNNAGAFAGSSSFTYASATAELRTAGSLVVGVRTGTIGQNSFVQGVSGVASGVGSSAMGQITIASGYTAHAQGYSTVAGGYAAHAEGFTTIANGTFSHAEGINTAVYSEAGHAEGQNTVVSGGSSAHAQNYYTMATGSYSHAGGRGLSTVGLKVRASGQVAFNHSENTNLQTGGHGALANNSVILGGINHNIETGNVRSAIIGGNAIKLTGTSYIDTVAVPALAIFATPGAGGSEDVLTWNPTSKKINKVTQGSISDERLKTAITPLENVVTKIKSLRTAEFVYNEVNEAGIYGTKDYGLIAQEVEQAFPHVVKNNLNIDNVDYKTVDYRKLVPVLFAAIKELTDRIEELEKK